MSNILKFAGLVTEHLPDMDTQVRQGWIDNPRALKEALERALCPPVDKAKEVVNNVFLKLLNTAEIPATDGTGMIGKEGDFFTGFLDSDYQKWGLNTKSEAKPATKIEVHQLIKDGRFNQFIPSLNRPMKELSMTQSQVLWVIKNRPNLLNQKGYANFFVLDKGEECPEEDRYFVAYLRWFSDGRHEASVYRFSRDGVWSGDCSHRLIVPATVVPHVT